MKTKKTLILLLFVAASFVLFGCGSAGVFNEGNMTDVQLSQANYKIVATDVHGESTAAYILGSTISNGMSTQIYAIYKVSGTDRLYTDAINNLWKDFGKKNGDIIGKKYALVNVRYDAKVLNLFVYTSVTISVRADVVEFVDAEIK
jgi:hypothetical protein